ncbi:hypothetical protein DPEC_G00138200 [Dallia pectoralis]|uniref:Uncharacterized protein n=1 Tax=Dallia pectoralis TaxID=75939 RepID=A0ACC2GLT9_DALPE|nr:hypothetical protein DPEC_G00138200 [Dallia pectoralis]
MAGGAADRKDEDILCQADLDDTGPGLVRPVWSFNVLGLGWAVGCTVLFLGRTICPGGSGERAPHHDLRMILTSPNGIRTGPSYAGVRAGRVLSMSHVGVVH